jgi:hypothetical protein
MRPSESKVRARSGGQPGHSNVVVRGIVLRYSVSLRQYKQREGKRERERIQNPKPLILILSLYFGS